MNKVHRIDLPRIVLIGRGVLGQLGEICRELGVERALIATGRVTYGVAGGSALDILRASGVRAKATYVTEADLENVERVRRETAAEGADAVVGVGGGRIIDVAKLSAARSGTFFISVPTTASHDGIASSLASIKGLGRPYSMKAKAPIAVVADSQIIAESPYRFTASGCGDVISKAVAVRDWRLAHEVKGEYYGDYAGSLSLMSSSLVMESAHQIRDRLEAGYRTLLEALVSCGVAMSIAGSSRPCSGSAHLFSHALDMLASRPALHGEQCGVGTIMMAKLHGLDWRAIRERLSIIDAPTTARELGISRETVIEALEKAGSIRPERYTILNSVNLTAEAAETLAEECGVI
ncbi:MAG: NAD(P)-dependent glycerol-1-phosphate dehydrogenase [Candidatus Bathyarchaeia archaeon]